MIDAHQHFWRIERGDYGWLDGAGPPLYRDYLPHDLEPQLRRFGIGRSIVVQAAATLAETQFLLDLAEAHDFIAGVVGWLDFEADDFAGELSRLKRRPKFVGLRPMLQDLDDDRWILRPRVLAALELVAASDIVFDILALPRQLPFVSEAMERTPGLRAVIDHLSKPSIASGEIEPWKSDISRLAEMPSICCKLSGMVTEASHGAWSIVDLRPYVQHVVDCFGPDRLLWGSDWPVCRLAAEYGDVLAAAMLALPPDLRGDARIFGGNAERVYRLPSDGLGA